MYEIFKKLCDEKGIKAADVAKGTGIYQALFSEWKKGKSKPGIDKMIKIANFFDVSVEYLMTGEKNHSKEYYLDEESRDIAEFIRDNPDYKALFDTTRKVKPEDINFVKELIERMTHE